MGILVLFLILEETLSAFHSDVSCGFVIYGLCYVKVCSLCTHFVEFYHKWILILSNAFPTSFEIITWFLSFILLMWCITLINMQMLNPPCIPGINPTWSWCVILLIYCWIWFASIKLRIFASVFIQGNDPETFLFCDVLVWFWYWGNAGFVK